MDKLTQYQKIVRGTLAAIAERPYPIPTLTHEAVFDTENDRYLVLSIGWQARNQRTHHCLVHLDIIDGKIWVQQDHTEDGVTYDLEAAGVPKSDIVLAFHTESVRSHTGYAVL